jgi:pseudaminic acid synthase
MNKPFFIAEISANHCGSFLIAKQLIKLAKKHGANAVKLQTYKPDSMTPNLRKKNFLIKKGLWKGKNLWELYDKAKTPYAWHKKLFQYAKKIGIICFSTPFDAEAVDFLENLNCPFYKISSFEFNDFHLIEKIINTGKKIILSTGTASLAEITKTVNFFKKKKFKNFSIMYCVSNYPANLSDFHINNIKILKKKFNCQIGLSDHSKNNIVSALALSSGAEIFEKHIASKLSKKSPDYEFSLIEDEIKDYRDLLDNTYLMLKNKYFTRSKSELLYKKFRRSIFAIKDIQAGESFSIENIKLLRPKIGLGPEFFSKILKKRAKKFIKAYQPLKKHFIK